MKRIRTSFDGRFKDALQRLHKQGMRVTINRPGEFHVENGSNYIGCYTREEVISYAYSNPVVA